MEAIDEDAVREVAAFMERFNYFRKPYNERDKIGAGWVQNHGLAGDAVVYRAITGHGDIGLLLNRRPRFICFDVDVPGKGDDVPEPVENDDDEERQESAVEQEEWDEARPFAQDPRTWVGWAEIGAGGEVEEGLEQALREAKSPSIPSRKFQHELEPETRLAIEALLECFNEKPSLVARSPHGAHVYWCLEEEDLWYQLRPKLVKVKKAWEEKKRELGIERSLEIMPTPSRPLRIPRLDRLLELDRLEPMRRPADGEAFWQGLRRYQLKGLIKEEVLEREWPKEDRPGPRLREREVVDRARGMKGQTDAGLLSLRPRNSREAEELLMPFRDGESNVRLIKMVEGGKRGGMSLDDVTEWILGWETRSREAGYSGDMFRNLRELRSRIESLYAACNVTEAGASRFMRLWEEKEGKYPRNREAAERMLERLESVSPQPKQSRMAVLRFFTNLEAWRRIIDDAVADPASGIDDLTRRNQGRGAYPLPSELIYEWYSGYDRIRAQILASGLLVKDEQAGGGYVPDLGRPQYYQLGIPELRG